MIKLRHVCCLSLGRFHDPTSRFPPLGPSDWFPNFAGTTRMLRLPAARPASLRFPYARRYLPARSYLLPRSAPCRPARARVCLPGTLPGVLRKETAGSPRFPGNPCTLALLYDPGRPAVSRRYRYSRCCHPIQITSLALQTRDFVAQLHSSRTRCLRLAAGLPFPAQDSLCGLLARLWPCGAFTHWVSFSSFKKASDSSFPLDPGLAWRNSRSQGVHFPLTQVCHFF